MKIIVIGAGEVGMHLSRELGKDHNVTLIDSDPARAEEANTDDNVQGVCGSGSDASVLEKFMKDGCDCFLAMTSTDEVNLTASSIARYMGARYVISRIHDQTYMGTKNVNYGKQFGINLMLNPEGLCALDLAKSIRSPGRIAVENFARGEIEAQRITVRSNARWCGQALREIKLPNEIKFGYLERNDKGDVPHADTVLCAGDEITVFGPRDRLKKVRSLLDPEITERPVNVVILGGSETAVALIRLLDNPRFRVRVIEKDEKKSRRLADTFSHITVINGDGTSLRLLTSEDVGEADFFVASTSDDELNIMASIQVAQLPHKPDSNGIHVQIVINKSDYHEILENLQKTLNIEQIVSPRIATASEIKRRLEHSAYTVLYEFKEQPVRIVEIEVREGSSCARKSLREITWPKHAVLVALLDQSEVKVPGANDVLEVGSRVIAITREENIPEILKLLQKT
jgi:trk system potassium uptake protein TrkA